MIHLFKSTHFTTSQARKHIRIHEEREGDRRTLHVCILIFSTHRSVRLTAFSGGKWSYLAFSFISLRTGSLHLLLPFFISFFRFAITFWINISNSSNYTHNIYHCMEYNKRNENPTLYMYTRTKSEKTTKETKTSKQTRNNVNDFMCKCDCIVDIKSL